MQEVSAGPLLDRLRKGPRHLNVVSEHLTGNEMGLGALQVQCSSYSDSYKSVTDVTAVSSC